MQQGNETWIQMYTVWIKPKLFYITLASLLDVCIRMNRHQSGKVLLILLVTGLFIAVIQSSQYILTHLWPRAHTKKSSHHYSLGLQHETVITILSLGTFAVLSWNSRNGWTLWGIMKLFWQRSRFMLVPGLWGTSSMLQISIVQKNHLDSKMAGEKYMEEKFVLHKLAVILQLRGIEVF